MSHSTILILFSLPDRAYLFKTVEKAWSSSLEPSPKSRNMAFSFLNSKPRPFCRITAAAGFFALSPIARIFAKFGPARNISGSTLLTFFQSKNFRNLSNFIKVENRGHPKSGLIPSVVKVWRGQRSKALAPWQKALIGQYFWRQASIGNYFWNFKPWLIGFFSRLVTTKTKSDKSFGLAIASNWWFDCKSNLLILYKQWIMHKI